MSRLVTNNSKRLLFQVQVTGFKPPLGTCRVLLFADETQWKRGSPREADATDSKCMKLDSEVLNVVFYEAKIGPLLVAL